MVAALRTLLTVRSSISLILGVPVIPERFYNTSGNLVVAETFWSGPYLPTTYTVGTYPVGADGYTAGNG